MAVVFGAVDAHVKFTGSSVVIASQAWTNGTLYIIHVYEKVTTASPAVPTSIAGSTMTFQRVTSNDLLFDVSGANKTRWSTWVAIGNGNTEAVTINCAQADVEAWYDVIRWTGTKTTNGGLDAIVQGVPQKGTAVNPSINLAALQDSGSMAVGMFASGNSISVGSGFTAMGSDFNATVYFDERQANVTTVNIVMTSAAYGGVAYEIAAPASSSFVPKIIRYG